MIEEPTDLDFVRDSLPHVEPTMLGGPDRARQDLLAHIAAAGDALAAHPRRPGRRGPRRRGTHRQRRALQLGAVGVAAAAAAFAAVNLASGGHDGAVSEAQAKQIVARASAGTDPVGAQVLSYTFVNQNGTVERDAQNGETPQTWAFRATAADGTPNFADGQEGGRREFYDPSTQTIYRDADGSMVVSNSSSDEAFFDEMNAPGAKLTTDTDATTNDGRPATKVTSVERDGNTYELWVDPDARDRPLQFVWIPPSGPTKTLVWRDYQTATPGAGDPSPARLSDDYPSAKVVTLGAVQFRAAWKKAGLG
jgi:hypothetical protein